MTSGQFHMVPLGDILVKRDERQRRELSDIDVLADSIRRLGLIHPLVVTRELELVTGERRYTAITKLGWTHVPCQFTDELKPSALRAIELEENIKRQDISWQDQVNAILEYHRLRASEEDEWTQNDTAEAIGLSRIYVSHLLQAGREIESGNEMVTNAPRLSTALGIVRRAQERKDAQAIEKLHSGFSGVDLKVTDPFPESIITADFHDWVLDYDGPRFNFLHVDFPYGIEADAFNQGSAPSHGGYADTRETWQQLMGSLDYATKRIVAPSAHIMFWFAMRKGDERLYEPTARWLSQMGWEINPMPLIWVKSDGSGIIPDPERGPRQIYETCLLGSRGDRKIVRAVSNAYSAPTVRERHMSEKPEPMLRYFFGMLVDENTVMLDPTCGSGSALRAAESLSARHVLGLEVNPKFAELAREALTRSRRLRKATADA